MSTAESSPRPPRALLRGVCVLAALAALGAVVLSLGRERSPQEEVVHATDLLVEKEWGELRAGLCTLDRGQYTEADLAQVGQVITLALRGVEGFSPGGVETLSPLRAGERTLQVRRVRGSLDSALGPSSQASVSLVRERGRWRVCFSAGGYSLAALSLDVPPGAPPVLPQPGGG